MTVSPLPMRTLNATRPDDGSTTAEIVSHPQRLWGLVTKLQAAQQLLVQQKHDAITRIEKMISEVSALRREDNVSQVDLMIGELELVLSEVQVLNPQELSGPGKFSEIADRLRQVSVGFMYGVSAVSLRSIGRTQK